MIVENLDFKKMQEDGTLLSVNQLCGVLDVSAQTIYSWYQWYNDDSYEKPENTPELPSYIQSKKYTKRFWYDTDVEKLVEFKKFIGKGRAGKMGEYNARKWQDRGVRALNNKNK